MSKQRILIIDDHKDFREMIRSFIQRQFKNIQINEAETGEKGIQITKITNPDITLIDVRLPGIDGFETARRIKVLVPKCQAILMSMFNKHSLPESWSKDPIIFIGKKEIDSQLMPILIKLLNGHNKGSETTQSNNKPKNHLKK